MFITDAGLFAELQAILVRTKDSYRHPDLIWHSEMIAEWWEENNANYSSLSDVIRLWTRWNYNTSPRWTSHSQRMFKTVGDINITYMLRLNNDGYALSISFTVNRIVWFTENIYNHDTIHRFLDQMECKSEYIWKYITLIDERNKRLQRQED